MTIRLAMPDWVSTIRLHDVESATCELAELLAQSQERGRVGRGELESAASQVVEEAFERGVRLLGLVRPPGRPAALLSAMGLDLDTALDGPTASALRSFLVDRGGTGISGLRSFDVDGVGTVVTLHRHDASGAQAQAVLADPDGQNWYLLTLAALDASRGEELQDVLIGLIRAGGFAGGSDPGRE